MKNTAFVRYRRLRTFPAPILDLCREGTWMNTSLASDTAKGVALRDWITGSNQTASKSDDMQV